MDFNHENNAQVVHKLTLLLSLLRDSENNMTEPQNNRWPSVSYRRCEGLELIANGDHVSANCPQF